MRRFNTLVAVTSISILSACSLFEPTPRARTLKLDENEPNKHQVMVLDATSRLVTVTNNGGPDGKKRVVCSEPSPDALTAQSAAIAAQGGTPKVGFGFGAAASEAAASIGLRTQTIQLLRDGYYRLCEAYMNGMISRESYYVVLAEIDNLMITLLVIDTVAGVPRAPAIAITPGIPSINTELQVTEGGGSDATTGTDGSVAITGQAPKLEIEKVSASSGALGEHDAKVLLAALDGAKESSRRIQCLTVLADPRFFVDRLAALKNAKIEGYNVHALPTRVGASGPLKNGSLFWALPQVCDGHMSVELNEYHLKVQKTQTDVSARLKGLEKQIKDLGKKLEGKDTKLVKAKEELAGLAKEFAIEVLKMKQVINVNNQ